MNYFLRSTLYTLLFSFFLTQSTHAQSRSGAGNSYIFHVLYLSDVPDRVGATTVKAGIDLKFQTEGKTYQIGAVRNSLTRPFRYNGPSRLSFFEEDVVEEGSNIQNPLVSSELGMPGTKLIVVTKGSDQRMRSLVIDIDSRKFREGHFRIMNFSNQLVIAKVDKILREIKSRGSYDFKVKGEGNRFPVDFGLAVTVDKRPNVIEQKRVFTKKDGKKLFLVYNDQVNPGKLTYQELRILTPDKVKNVSDEDLAEIDVSIYRDFGGGGDDTGE